MCGDVSVQVEQSEIIRRSPAALRSCNGVLWRTCRCILYCLVGQRDSRQVIFYVTMNVCDEFFVNGMVSGSRVEGLVKVYCCKKYSESRLCCVEASKNVYVICVMSVCGMVGSKSAWG